MKSAYLGGIAFALAASIIYGAVPNFARLAFLNGVPALETVLYRTTTVAVVLGLMAVIRRESLRITKANLPAFIFQCVATLLVSACYLASLQFLPVTLSVIIFYLFPLMIVLIAPLAERQFPGWARIAVSIFGFAGLVVAIGPAFENVSVIGLLLAFLGSVGCMLQFFSGRMLSRHLTPTAFGGLVHLAIWPLVLALALSFGDGSLHLVAGHASLGPSAFVAVVLVCITYLGGYFFHMSSVNMAPSSVVAPYFNVEPIVSTALAVLILGEMMTINHWVGGAMVLAAVIVAGTLREKQL